MVQAGQRGEDITGQVFMPVEPVNHLGFVIPGQPPPLPLPPPGPTPLPDTTLDGIYEYLTKTLEAIQAVHARLDAIEKRPIAFPTYRARIFGQSITFTPDV